MWGRILELNYMGLCPECIKEAEMVMIQESFDMSRICDRCGEEY